VTTVRCHDTVCQPTRTSAAVAGPHRMAVFRTLQACELYRQTMQQMHQQAVSSPTQLLVNVHKEFTYTCHESEEPL
jgi:hypothetical protein